jgi:hypothetical protein
LGATCGSFEAAAKTHVSTINCDDAKAIGENLTLPEKAEAFFLRDARFSISMPVIVEDNGLEQPHYSLGNNTTVTQGGTESGTVERQSGTDDVELERIVKAWPRLREQQRRAILAVLD